ncbi:MAG: hypothetical protein ACOYB1_18330 [Limnohabitans sp.]
MSRATDQTLVMLATIAGCLETFRQCNSFARVDIRKTINDGFAACQQAIIHWSLMSNRYWVKERRDEFTAFIFAHPDRGYSSVVLACMCERIVTYLAEQNKGNAGRMRMLAPIASACKTIHDFCDAGGANFPAYEKSDELLDMLYKIIELPLFCS